MVGPLTMLGGACQLPWHEFQSQLFPHVGSQDWPGHQGMGGPGCASASVAAAKPAHPKPAAITAAAAILLANLFMRISIRAQPMRSPSRPLRSDEQLQTTPVLYIPTAAASRVTFGRFGTKTRFGPPVRQCGSSSRTRGTAPPRDGTHKSAADRGGKTVHRGRVRGIPR